MKETKKPCFWTDHPNAECVAGTTSRWRCSELYYETVRGWEDCGGGKLNPQYQEEEEEKCSK